MSKWRTFLLSLVGLAMMPAAAIADTTIDSVVVSPSTVVSGGMVDITVTVTTAGTGSDDDWDATNITLINGPGLDTEILCDNTELGNGDGTYMNTFMGITIPANTAPGVWDVQVTAFDGGDTCDATPEADEDVDTSQTLTVEAPVLVLTKTGTGPAGHFTMAGDVLNYTYAILNTDVVPYALPADINDDLIPDMDISCPATDDDGNMDGSLDPGETTTCTGTYTVQAGDVTNGFVTNCATADVGAETSNESCETLGLDLGINVDAVLCLDGSGSIDPADWQIQLDGTADGLQSALSPNFVNGTVRITVVVFSDNALVEVGPTIIDSQMTLDNFTAGVQALAQPGDFTNTADCISVAHSVMCPGGDGLGRGDCPDNGVRRVIDISTDGDPTVDNCANLGNQACAVFRSDEAEMAGIDVLNVLGVGPGPTEANMVQWAFPEPVPVFNASMGEFPMEGDEGFVLVIDDFTDYEPAIEVKIGGELMTTFTVNKVYSDDNMTPVDIMLTCTGNTVIDPPNPAPASPMMPAVFNVSGYDPMTDTCTAVEVNASLPPGYTKDEMDCMNVGIEEPGSCTITNTRNTGQFTVFKDFDDDNPTPVDVMLSCTGVNTTIDSNNPLPAADVAMGEAVFDVSGFEPSDTCTAMEVNASLPPGYTKNEDDCQDGMDLADGGSCTIVNTLTTTTFTVTKSYNDDNMDPVSVTLVCTGNITIDPPNPAMAAPGAPAMFTVNGFEQGDTCTATETVPTGYTWSNPMDCENVGVLDPGSCNLNNNVNRTTFTVTKSYSDDNMNPVSVTLMCTGVNTMIEPPNPAMASPAVPAQFGVTGFDPGVDTCTATEVVPMGYDWTNPMDCQAVGLPEPGGCNLNNALIEIDLAKTVDGPPTLEMDGTYTVFYTITATNTGAGGGVYDIIDAFSPGSGISLNTATATYDVGVGEDDQSGMLGNFPVSGTIVTGEGLAGGQFETWSVEANFNVDPTMVDPMDRDCTPGQPVMDTGFYNEVSGSATDPNPGNNADCEGLPDPQIDLSKTVVADSVTLEANGTYTVQYTIEANNLGDGPGTYAIIDNVAPGTGISFNTAMIAYQVGVGEDDTNGVIGAYPNLVTGEALAGQQFERWTLTVNFTVDPPNVDPGTADCTPGMPITGTGFYNAVTGSDTDPNPGNNADCDGLPDPVIDLAKEVTSFVDNGGGAFTVTYTVTATNTGDGPGFYDLIDNVLPGSGIVPVLQQLTSYNAGTENDQSGMLAGMLPYTFTNGELLVDDEALAGQRNESWTVTVNFQIEGGQVGNDYLCAGPNTGTYNEVEGSSTDPNPGNNNDCENPPELRTTFRVTKDFSDDNPAGVTVSIQCNTGLPLQQSGVVHDPDAVGLGPGDFTVIEFIVGDFEIGTMDCDIEEEIPAGYEPTYTAGATTGIAVDIFDDEEGCHYEDISFGTFTCGIYNELQPVDVVVEKQWIDENPAFQSPTWVEITLECDGPIEGGYPCFGGRSDPENYCIQQYIDPANPGEFEVLPHFEGTTCSATEEPIVGVLTDESDCEEMIVFPGQGDSCVIVNTRLYAGIPTLNQYGLILLALLMLGVGAVAYRRFA